MTNEEAIIRVRMFGLHHAKDDLPFSVLTVEAFRMAIEALKKQSAIKSELKSMKNIAYGFLNDDYKVGYISAISTIEGFLASEEIEV